MKTTFKLKVTLASDCSTHLEIEMPTPKRSKMPIIRLQWQILKNGWGKKDEIFVAAFWCSSFLYQAMSDDSSIDRSFYLIFRNGRLHSPFVFDKRWFVSRLMTSYPFPHSDWVPMIL